MATLTVHAVSKTGADVFLDAISAVAPAVGGDAFANTGKEVIIYINNSSNPSVVTIAAPYTLDGKAVASRTVSVPAGKTYGIGPLSPSIYNDTNGLVQLTYSAVTSCAISIIQVTPL